MLQAVYEIPQAGAQNNADLGGEVALILDVVYGLFNHLFIVFLSESPT